MSDWTAGYVADVGYTYGYYGELNPLRTKLAFLLKGLKCPEFGAACELGFGQGLSANFHAAASLTSWHGTDFNPSQADFAQELSAAAGANAKRYDETFADFAVREDLPDFDYIGLHGIWSWISEENRSVIVDFIRRKLKVGGVLYISYYTLPGWAAFAPMRHLMTQHAEIIGSEGRGIVSRIDGALDFANKLLNTNPVFARANPFVGERIKTLKGQSRHYLAHEYFNRDWHPMHFATMAGWLEPAKVQYACSAHYLDHVDAINLTVEQQSFLKDIPDVSFRESVRDFMVNQQFRRDYWVKGARTISELDKTEILRTQRIILTTHRADVSLKVTGPRGDADMSEAIYSLILDCLADHKVKTLLQIEQAMSAQGVSFTQLLQAVCVLLGMGHVLPVQDDAVIQRARKSCDKLNEDLIHRARGNGDITYLASPVSGGGIVATRFQQLFLMSLRQGKKQPTEWAHDVWEILAAQGQRLIKDGRTMESTEENLAELTEQAQVFAAKHLPILKALQIA